MKYLTVVLFLIQVLMVGCGDVSFEIDTNSTSVENENVVISDEDGVIETGSLPFTVTVKKREVLTAKFNVTATNFAGNHSQCDCKKFKYNYYECTEEFEVNGNDWNIAE